MAGRNELLFSTHPGICRTVSGIKLLQHFILIDLLPAEYWLPESESRKEPILYSDLRFAADTQWMVENGWKTEIKLEALVEGLIRWEVEKAEARTKGIAAIIQRFFKTYGSGREQRVYQ